MKKRRPDTQIPPKWLVRLVASVVLVFGLVIVYVVATNFAALGLWAGAGYLLVGFSVTGAASMSLATGSPEWILLNLILTP